MNFAAGVSCSVVACMLLAQLRDTHGVRRTVTTWTATLCIAFAVVNYVLAFTPDLFYRGGTP